MFAFVFVSDLPDFDFVFVLKCESENNIGVFPTDSDRFHPYGSFRKIDRKACELPAYQSSSTVCFLFFPPVRALKNVATFLENVVTFFNENFEPTFFREELYQHFLRENIRFNIFPISFINILQHLSWKC
jgi:hypothetical protein